VSLGAIPTPAMAKNIGGPVNMHRVTGDVAAHFDVSRWIKIFM
jgi:hypothetical protein